MTFIPWRLLRMFISSFDCLDSSTLNACLFAFLSTRLSCNNAGGDVNDVSLLRAPQILSRITKIGGTGIRLGYRDFT